MLTVTVTPDLPGEPTGTAVVVEPGATYHLEQTFTGPKLVTLTVKAGRVIFSVADPPPPTPPPAQ